MTASPNLALIHQALRFHIDDGSQLALTALTVAAVHAACSGSQRGIDRVFAVPDGLAVGARVVGAVECRLQVELHRRVRRQERHRDHGQPPLQSDRIDKKFLGPVEAVDRDVVVERAGLLLGDVFGDRRDVRAGAQQIDLDQVRLARQDFTLLGAVQVVAFLAGSLVGRADHFDRGDQSVLAAPAAVNLEKVFDMIVVLEGLDGDQHGLTGLRVSVSTSGSATATPP